jgi:formylglycine-generating enzyme required for sulfatase activity
VISGAPKGNLDIYVGSVAAVRAKPNTQLILQKVEKTKDSSEVRIKLEKGSLLTRLRKLTGQSRFILETPGAVAAARGTAYLTSYDNNITNVLVAEGTVAVSLVETPTQELMVGESQKVEVDKILPAAATNVTKLDAGIVKELLAVALPPSPEPKLGEISINPKDGAEMVWVPKGEFLMGLEQVGSPSYPHHKVYLDGYWMYKTEVTVAQFQKFCSETSRVMPTAPDWGWIENHPIVNVTWQDAVDYAKWAGASLPTEAQWEKAARGTEGRKFPWGNQWDSTKCNEKSTGPQKTQPVGSYPAGASPFGCMDMAGNVWEWCADWYAADYYTTSPYKNPTGPSSGKDRIMRGCSWNCSQSAAFNCEKRMPGAAFPCLGIGFRCAKTQN